MWNPFWLALQFLTRIPVPVKTDPNSVDIGRSLLAYPVVGLIIGLILIVPAQLFSSSDTLLLSVLLLMLWVLITGALHLDGLADSADAWIGGHGDQQRTLAIMKDPRSGPAGVATVVLMLMLKLTALNVVLQTGQWQALLLAPLLARATVPLLYATTDYVRPAGLGVTMAEYLPHSWLIHVVWPTLLLVLWLYGWQGIWLLVFLVLLGMGMRNRLIQRIGGTTGDTTGAVVEIIEAATLLFIAI